MTTYTRLDRNDPAMHVRLDDIKSKRWTQYTEDDYQWWDAQQFTMRAHTEMYAYAAVRQMAKSNREIGHLAKRNKELNKDLDNVWQMYRKHYGECASLRDNIVATICRFILRHT
jgi:hypothetical protein